MQKDEKIEGLKHLCRALCQHQEELHSKLYEAAAIAIKEEAELTSDFLTSEIPIIQGTAIQIDLMNIGKQDTDSKKIMIGIKYMLEKESVDKKGD